MKREVPDGEHEEVMVQELQRFIATPDSYFLEIVAALKEHSKCVSNSIARGGGERGAAFVGAPVSGV